MKGIPFSKLRGARHVGPEYFDRIQAVDDRSVRGLCDDLAIHSRADLEISRLDPRIRDFYENTSAYTLRVRPRWSAAFWLASRIWRTFARSVGQMEMPLHDERKDDLISSRLVALRESMDGRSSPRAWIRTYPDGRAMYIAAYSTHVRDGVAYMNIAFPLPCGNLTSILRMNEIPGGIVLTSAAGGDCGIFWVTGTLRFRMPLRETICVWAADAEGVPASLDPATPETTVVARHDMWLFGLRYLTLDYSIFPINSPV